MFVDVFYREVPPRMRREILLQSGSVTIKDRFMVFEVDEFIDFIRILYRSFAAISRESDPVSMRFPIRCFTMGIEFHVWVEGNAVRYGCV